VCGDGVIALLAQGDPPHLRRWRVPVDDCAGAQADQSFSGHPTASADSRVRPSPRRRTVEGNERSSADPRSNGTLTYSLRARPLCPSTLRCWPKASRPIVRDESGCARVVPIAYLFIQGGGPRRHSCGGSPGTMTASSTASPFSRTVTSGSSTWLSLPPGEIHRVSVTRAVWL
jgi:hypothetical protein